MNKQVPGFKWSELPCNWVTWPLVDSSTETPQWTHLVMQRRMQNGNSEKPTRATSLNHFTSCMCSEGQQEGHPHSDRGKLLTCFQPAWVWRRILYTFNIWQPQKIIFSSNVSNFHEWGAISELSIRFLSECIYVRKHTRHKQSIYSRMFSVFSCTMSVLSRLSARTKAPCSTVSSSMVAALSCSPVLSSFHAPWASGCSKLLTVSTMAWGVQIIDLVKKEA